MTFFPSSHSLLLTQYSLLLCQNSLLISDIWIPTTDYYAYSEGKTTMQTPLHILHIEDNKNDAKLIHHFLVDRGMPCNVTTVSSQKDFYDALTKGGYDIILCDYNLPSFSGTTALEAIRKQSPDVPFIFVSGTIGEDRAIDALKRGATDYVLKDRLDRLVPAIERALREVDEKKTRKNLEMQLLHAQRMESIGTLAGGVAHDFNNILGIIMGHSTLLEKYKDEPIKFSNSMQAILQAARRGASLVKQLLAFARKREETIELIQINDAVREAVKLLSETVPKSIEISPQLNDALPPISANPTQIQQVLLNLCVNARDAMPNGGALILTSRMVEGSFVRKKFLEASELVYVAIDIRDTGTGMSQETVKRIFEPFYTTKEEGKGTGLGLAVVYGIMKTHQGFIDVTSELGKGTTFTLYLPVKKTSLPSEAEQAYELEEVPGGTETVLVVEDEVLLRDLLKLTLESKGYTVFIAKDGEEAVEIYQWHYQNINLVLGDFQLPKLNGYEVFKELKTINPDVKFILATGFLEPEQREALEREGTKRIIQKPYVPEQIVKAIREVLEE